MNDAAVTVSQSAGISLLFLLAHMVLVRRFDRSLPRSIRTLPCRDSWNLRTRWLGRRRTAVWQMFWLNVMTAIALAIAGGILVSMSSAATFDQPSLIPATIVAGIIFLLAEGVHERLLRRWVRRQRKDKGSARRSKREPSAHHQTEAIESALPER